MADNNRQVGIKCTYLSLDNKLSQVQITTSWQPAPTCGYCMLNWGTPIDYAKEFKVENDEGHFIVKIDERFFALDYENIHYFKEVFPRKVIIEKLIFDVVS